MEKTQLTLLHFGDLHLWRLGFGGDYWPKRALGLANLILRRRRKFPPHIADLLKTRLAAESADFVIFSGDLGTTSLQQEFIAGAEFMQPLLAKWGERLIMIPGNHDRYTPRASREKWFERHLPSAPAQYPISVDLNQAWTLIAFDCSVPRLLSSRGRLDAGQFADLARMLEAAKQRGRKIVVVGHYPLLFPSGVEVSPEHLLEKREVVLELLKKKSVDLYLHGHKHRRWHLQDEGMLHLNCGSAGMAGEGDRAAGYLKIFLGAAGVQSVTAVELAPNNEWAEKPLPVFRPTLQRPAAV